MRVVAQGLVEAGRGTHGLVKQMEREVVGVACTGVGLDCVLASCAGVGVLDVGVGVDVQRVYGEFWHEHRDSAGSETGAKKGVNLLEAGRVLG